MNQKPSTRPNGNSWDEKAVSEGLLARAKNAEDYLRELRTKIDYNPHYKVLYDEALARFYVFNGVAVSASLDTRQSFLKELKSKEKNPFRIEERAPYSGAYDADRFAEFYRKCASELIEEFSDTGPE
jgi:hypothetical protein